MAIVIAIAILLVLTASLEAGFRGGRRTVTKDRERAAAVQLGAIQGATLGLLGLLLGFSFSGAASRFIERQDLVVQEANAIGTAYLRADMLDEPYRSDLRTALAEYVEQRVKVSEALSWKIPSTVQAEIDRFHRRIWEAASEGARAKPSTMVAVLPPVNESLDLHATRIASGRKHLPTLVIALLIVCSALAIGLIGFGCGLSGRRNLLMTASLMFLVAASLWTTIDLDYSRVGLIQISDVPLKDLQASFSEMSSTRPSAP